MKTLGTKASEAEKIAHGKLPAGTRQHLVDGCGVTAESEAAS